MKQKVTQPTQSSSHIYKHLHSITLVCPYYQESLVAISTMSVVAPYPPNLPTSMTASSAQASTSRLPASPAGFDIIAAYRRALEDEKVGAMNAGGSPH
jgi:hypothetical protein